MIEPIIDISKWQPGMDAATVVQRGVRGVYAKAGGVYWGSGQYFTDVCWKENVDKFSGILPFGGYFWFEPAFDGAGQGAYFVSLLQNVNWRLPPAIDVESNPKRIPYADFQRQLHACIKVVEDQLGVKPVIYTRGSFWNTNLGNVQWASAYKLWIAIYNDGNNPFAVDRYRPMPWKTWWLWQYSDTGDGPYYGTDPYKSKSIDLNRCNMTESEWAAFTQGEYTPVEPTIPETVSVNTRWGLRLREKPTTQNSEILSVLLNNTVLTVTAKDGDWYKVSLDGWVHKDYVR